MFTRGLGRILCVAALLVGTTAQAQSPILATAQSIAGGDATSRVDPVERTLTISTAGVYNITLTDLKQPAAFVLLRLAVTSGTSLVASATVAAGGAPSSVPLSAPVGTYTVHVIAALAAGQSFGTAGVQVTDSMGAPVNGFAGPGGTPVSGFTAALSLPPAPVPPNAQVIDRMIQITAAGNYELDIKDFSFPAGLAAFTVNLADPSGNVVVSALSAAPGGSNSATFAVGAAATGSYHLVGAAQAASGASGGLFNLHAFNTGTSADALSESDSLGQVAALGNVTLTAGPYSLALTDYAFPKPLSNGVAVAVRGSSIVASTAGGSPASFNAQAGEHLLFALAVPESVSGSGAYGVTLAPQGGATAFSSVRTTSSGVGNVSANSYPVTITNAGSYSLTLADFQFPQSFATLAVAAAQNGVLLSAPLTAPGTSKLSPAAGQMFILAAATAGSGGQGVFGIDLAPSAGGAATFDVTQGVGAAFGTTTFSVTTAGSYNVTLSDLAFPGNFNQLSAVVTQGATRLGSIYGGGTFAFAATPGTYVINVLGVPQPIIAGATQTAGTYGLSVAPTPPAPTVTFSANATQVDSGGTVTLTWSSQNATSCTASGGWSGALPAFGTQVSPPISSATTFTLTCAGDGGSTSQSLSVSVRAPSSPGGGGSLDALALVLLALGVIGRARATRP